ncbi:MAG: response regulator transcription factor [Bacteroidetes bacterium]|jgi:DNA-binding LytR/AlgR family response regulator|nr:response regulator transcription factor [Bacteroidota bacterium]
MRVIIIEDERPATDRLQTLLIEYDPSIEVVACLESIEETVQYLKQHAHPDLLLLDIHLSDGHSFEIFKQVTYQKPVMFITAYDQYALNAFKMFSIDYILKPVSLEMLATALNKLKSLAGTFSAVDFNRLIPEWQPNPYKKRFLGKVGQRLFFIDTATIAFFQADNKIVYLVDKEGNRYVIEHTMEKLEEQLDPQYFFRLNRRFIVHIEAIQQVKPYFNNRLKLSVKGAGQSDDMVISRERVAGFKEWAQA